MHLKKTLVLGSLLFLSGCLAPKKPVLEMTHYDFEAQEFIAVMTDDIHNTYVKTEEEMDGATAFSPENWEKIRNYTHKLEEYIKVHCK